MYNAVSKGLLAMSLLAAVASCGNPDREAAQTLCEKAEAEVMAGDYSAAVELLDTLDSRYAKEVEIRRSAMKFRAMAIEGLTIRRISIVDDTLALLKSRLDGFEPQFDYVENPGKGLGGNYIAKTIVKLSSDILPRINDEGYFTLSVKINRPIGFEYVKFFDSEQSAATTPISPDRLVSVENTEMTALQQEDVNHAFEWLVVHQSADRYELVGAKSTIKQKLSDKLLTAMIETWQFAEAKQAYRLALIEREKLERKLQQCRDQLANLIDR